MKDEKCVSLNESRINKGNESLFQRVRERERDGKRDTGEEREVETAKRRASGVGELLEAVNICWQILIKRF